MGFRGSLGNNSLETENEGQQDKAVANQIVGASNRKLTPTSEFHISLVYVKAVYSTRACAMFVRWSSCVPFDTFV